MALVNDLLQLKKGFSDGNTAGELATLLGAVNQPASGTITVEAIPMGKFFQLDFTLTAAQIPVTDGAGSGSHGALKIFDFVEGSIVTFGCRQNYTAFAEGAALTGAAGDAVFKLGVGFAAVAAAADAALSGTSVDIGAATSNITLSGGTGTGTVHNATLTNKDGTGTAADIYLNWSGTAATIDANSTIDVTGTISIVGVFIGDD